LKVEVWKQNSVKILFLLKVSIHFFLLRDSRMLRENLNKTKVKLEIVIFENSM